MVLTSLADPIAISIIIAELITSVAFSILLLIDELTNIQKVYGIILGVWFTCTLDDFWGFQGKIMCQFFFFH